MIPASYLSDRRDPQTEVIIRLARDLERARDPGTSGHSDKVADIGVRIGNLVKLSDIDMIHLGYAAELHDIGKVHLSEYVINKPAALSVAEYDMVKQHTRYGADLLHGLVPPPVLEGILYHHEQWNGNGYPEGLIGEQIPMLARIIAIADVFEALTAKRSYRPAYSIDQALRIMVDMQRKEVFDPTIFEKFRGTYGSE